MHVKRILCEKTGLHIALYSAETWTMGVADKKRLNVNEMRCLRSVWDKSDGGVRNEEVSRKRVARHLEGRAEDSVLRWYGYVERMEDEKMVKKIERSSVRCVHV